MAISLTCKNSSLFRPVPSFILPQANICSDKIYLNTAPVFSSFNNIKPVIRNVKRTEMLEPHPRKFYGDVWALSVIGGALHAIGFISDIKKLQSLRARAFPIIELKAKIKKAYRHAIVSGISTAGSLAGSLYYMDRMKWIIIGANVAYLKGFSYLTGGLSAISGIIDAIRGLKFHLPSINVTEKILAKRRVSAIELSASIASLAWAVAKIGALVLGFPFLQFATTICLFASVGLATSAIIYKIHLTEKGKKEVHEKGKLSALA